MLDCISVNNMRLSDKQTIEKYVPSLELMYRAAYGVFLAVQWRGSIAIVVGSGNNGGDGFALARILHEHGLPCSVFTLSDKLSADSAFYADQVRKLPISVQPYRQGCLKNFDILVDCLLGTGFQGSVRGIYRQAIEEINQTGAYTVSVDINSGMNGDTGEAETAVISDLTVTIGYVKMGLITDSAVSYIKKLVCTDIGIVLAYSEDKICTEQEWDAISCKFQCKMPGMVIKDGIRYYKCPKWLDYHIIPSLL